MEQQQAKIGIREFTAIVILPIGTKLSDDTPAILYDALKNAAWMAPLIIGILVFLPIYILIKVLSFYQNKNLSEIIFYLFGKYIGYLIIFLLWLALFLALTVDSAIHIDIIGTMYFSRTPSLIMYGILLGICAYGASKGIEHIGSVAWSVLIYIKIFLFIALIITIGSGQFSFLFPIMGAGGWTLIKESSLKASLFAEFLYLGLIFPYLKSTKEFKKGTWIAFTIIIIELMAALTAYVLLFDYNGVQLLNYPFHEAIRYIRLGFLTNVESLFFPFWLVATFIRFSFYLYINAILFAALFKINDYKYIIPALATLVVFIGMIPETPTFTIFDLREQLLHFITPVFFTLPFLLWMVAKLKGDFKNGMAEINQ